MGIFNKDKIYLFDGSKGFMLQKYGLQKGKLAESYNITHPDIVRRIHMEYCDAGSDIIQTNTLCSNRLVLRRHGLEDKHDEINSKGVLLAKEAVNGRNVLVAASIGPIGELLQPFGPLTFGIAYKLFKDQITACKDADIINFETFTDLKEMRIAFLANQDTVNLPVICNMTYEKNNATLMGHSPKICSGILKKLGADVVGVNCSNGPEKMGDILKEIATFEDFTCVKPNAGVPRFTDGIALYDQEENTFCRHSDNLLKYNIGITGGCCGTTPDYIKAMNYVKEQKRNVTVPIDTRRYIFSQYRCVDIDTSYKIIDFYIEENQVTDCIDSAYDINEEECDVYRINYTGDDVEFISSLIIQLQDVLKKPYIFNFDNNLSLQSALRSYCGIAGVIGKSLNPYGAIKIS
ncbi:MAG: homocysteine S-methyltransferase family protein [Clostridia bacterium]|jgi:5-methyltetrahydrofolate--homocysteine methyltransferase